METNRSGEAATFYKNGSSHWSCSIKNMFLKIHREAPVSEYFFNKISKEHLSYRNLWDTASGEGSDQNGYQIF